ncbi:MAG: hypothetical protein JST59_02575 [Actinobacteria bacterium]|nr:hypothetical protein [Actinomycetota bacterium]
MFLDLALFDLADAVFVALQTVEMLFYAVVILEDELSHLMRVHTYTFFQIVLEHVRYVLLHPDHLEEPLSRFLFDLLFELVFVFGKAFTLVAELPNEDLFAAVLMKAFGAAPTLDVRVAAQLRTVFALPCLDVVDAALHAVRVHLSERENVGVILPQVRVLQVAGSVSGATSASP